MIAVYALMVFKSIKHTINILKEYMLEEIILI